MARRMFPLAVETQMADQAKAPHQNALWVLVHYFNYPQSKEK